MKRRWLRWSTRNAGVIGSVVAAFVLVLPTVALGEGPRAEILRRAEATYSRAYCARDPAETYRASILELESLGVDDSRDDISSRARFDRMAAERMLSALGSLDYQRGMAWLEERDLFEAQRHLALAASIDPFSEKFSRALAAVTAILATRGGTYEVWRGALRSQTEVIADVEARAFAERFSLQVRPFP